MHGRWRLIYFGYPQAHEDDAERAVRAGLALIEAVGKLRIQDPPQVRIEGMGGVASTVGREPLRGAARDWANREEELELLRRWSRANDKGQVVLIGGEAGIGKSRLTAALMESLGGEPHTRLRYFCSPQHTGSALYPIISQMERAAGLEHDDTQPVWLDKLDALLAQTATEMLSLPNDGRYPALEPAP